MKTFSKFLLLLLALLPIASFAVESGNAVPGELLSSGYLLKLGSGLVAVILLFIAMAWIMRNMGVGTVSKDGMDRLKVKATLSVGTRERVILIEAGNEQILLGVTQGQINTLHVLNSTTSAASKDFASALEKSMDSKTLDN